MDDTSKQLVAETRQPLPPRPGQPQRFDCEYERHGTANRFLLTARLGGWRHASVTDRHTRLDWATEVRQLLAVYCPKARRGTLVSDNPSVHSFGSLYAAFPPEEARRL